MPAYIILLLSLFFSPLFSANSLAENSLGTSYFNDDLGYRGLANALEKSCRYYENTAEHIFELCGQRLTGHELNHSYSQIISHLQEQPDQDIRLFLSENFTPCRPTSLLVTGYYSPELSGTLTPTGSYKLPLYGLPAQEDLRKMSRAGIDSATPLKGLEIAYLSDPLDLFFLHVQGSGIIQLPDGSRRLASYAGSNDRPYTSIGKILIKEGKLQREEVSMAVIHRYLTGHPEQRARILNQNERYIFFSLSPPQSGDIVPTGSLGFALTAGRSVAMDADHYPPGILGILTSQLPSSSENEKISWRPFSRLVTNHDSGAAIKGPHRLDLYMGSGQEAGQAAGVMKKKGSFAILIPNLSFRKLNSRIENSNNIAQSPNQMAPLTVSGE